LSLTVQLFHHRRGEVHIYALYRRHHSSAVCEKTRHIFVLVSHARDGIRHFAYCIPDPNALYLDHEYAATTRWGGIIAPPGYLYAHGSPVWLGRTPAIRDAGGKELEGNDNATEAWKFFRPVRRYDAPR
jgi:hypothetical protein